MYIIKTNLSYTFPTFTYLLTLCTVQRILTSLTCTYLNLQYTYPSIYHGVVTFFTYLIFTCFTIGLSCVWGYVQGRDHLAHNQKKVEKINSLKLNHSDIISAVSFVSCSSSWLIRKMNYWWLFKTLKFGYFSKIFSNQGDLLPYNSQSISICCSLSTAVLQNLHHLFSFGIVGLKVECTFQIAYTGITKCTCF